MNHVYFVAFTADDPFGGPTKFGNCQYESSIKIDDYPHIHTIKQDLEKEYGSRNVIILNYQLLRSEKNEKEEK